MGPSPQAVDPVGAAKAELCTVPCAPALSPAASQLSFRTGKTAGKEGLPILSAAQGLVPLLLTELSSREGTLSSHHIAQSISEHPLLQSEKSCSKVSKILTSGANWIISFWK